MGNAISALDDDKFAILGAGRTTKNRIIHHYGVGVPALLPGGRAASRQEATTRCAALSRWSTCSRRPLCVWSGTWRAVGSWPTRARRPVCAGATRTWRAAGRCAFGSERAALLATWPLPTGPRCATGVLGEALAAARAALLGIRLPCLGW